MAFSTGDPRMFPVELETGLVVVELYDFPPGILVAPATICLAVLVELPVVAVLVAGRAGRQQTRKLLDVHPVFFFLKMT